LLRSNINQRSSCGRDFSFGINELDYSTHGIDDASSAIDAAMVMTNKLGISHPKTMPTCPPKRNIPHLLTAEELVTNRSST